MNTKPSFSTFLRNLGGGREKSDEARPHEEVVPGTAPIRFSRATWRMAKKHRERCTFRSDGSLTVKSGFDDTPFYLAHNRSDAKFDDAPPTASFRGRKGCSYLIKLTGRVTGNASASLYLIAYSPAGSRKMRAELNQPLRYEPSTDGETVTLAIKLSGAGEAVLHRIDLTEPASAERPNAPPEPAPAEQEGDTLVGWSAFRRDLRRAVDLGAMSANEAVFVYDGQGHRYIDLPECTAECAALLGQAHGHSLAVSLCGEQVGKLDLQLFFNFFNGRDRVGHASVPIARSAVFRVPEKANRIALSLRVAGQGEIRALETVLRLEKTVASMSRARLRDAGHLDAEDAHTLKIATICDTFTFHNISSLGEIIRFKPTNWRSVLSANSPDLLFIESAWEGNGGAWSGMVRRCSPELRELVEWCRSQGVPTVFWNKEDPVHFDAFIETAGLADRVYTVDREMLDRYVERLGHSRVGLFQFAANPALQNPIELPSGRKPAASFAGTYYADKFPERRADMDRLFDVAAPFGLEIYDRQHGTPRGEYQIPERFRPFVRGSVPFGEIASVYKGYRVGLNLSSVKTSPTMVARRVFELAASGTPIVSNRSVALLDLLGDLAVSSDDPAVLSAGLRRLFENDDSWRESSVRAMQTVLRRHTYEDRFAQVVTDLGLKFAFRECKVALVLVHRDGAELSYLRRLAASCDTPHVVVEAYEPDLAAAGDVAKLIADLDVSHVAFLNGADGYAPEHVDNLMLHTRYADAAVITRGGDAEPALQFAFTSQASWRSSVFKREALAQAAISGADLLADRFAERLLRAGATILQVDRLDFQPGASGVPAATTATPKSPKGKRQANGLNKVLADARQWASSAELQSSGPEPIDGDRGVQARVNAPGNHGYLLFGGAKGLRSAPSGGAATSPLIEGPTLVSVDDLGSTGVDARLVIAFFREGAPLAQVQVMLGSTAAVTPPTGADAAALGLRVTGVGDLQFRVRVEQCNAADPVPDLFKRAKVAESGDDAVLVVSNTYPRAQNIYRNGFVHSRVRGYRRHGVNVHVCSMETGGAEAALYAFEGVPVVYGGASALRRLLLAHPYRTICVHFMDRTIYETIRQYAPQARIVVWIHGVETEQWHRRWFNYDLAASDLVDTVRQQMESGRKRCELMAEVYKRAGDGVDVVFVSDWFRRAVAEPDTGVRLSSYHVIPNFIDEKLFKARRKTGEMRKRLLSIRPYASRKYANDLTVQAIRRLSRESWFDELEFTVVGSGRLFTETVAPLHAFPNVTVEERFLTQSEIAEYHARHGVFLCPTRLDAQGVSMCEAMSSGLVPITTDTTAIPEFVSSEAGFLCEPESPEAIAEAVRRLYREPELFLRMSAEASRSIQSMCSSAAVLERELELIQQAAGKQ